MAVNINSQNLINMKDVKFVVCKGGINADGIKVDIDGVNIPDGQSMVVMMKENFTEDIGVARVSKKNGELVAQAFLNLRYAGSYPAVQVKYFLSDVVEKDGVKCITKCEVLAVGLSATPNADSSIEPIKLEVRYVQVEQSVLIT